MKQTIWPWVLVGIIICGAISIITYGAIYLERPIESNFKPQITGIYNPQYVSVIDMEKLQKEATVKILKDQIIKEQIDKELVEKENIRKIKQIDIDKKQQEIDQANKKRNNHIKILELRKSTLENVIAVAKKDVQSMADKKLSGLTLKDIAKIETGNFGSIDDLEERLYFYNTYIAEIKTLSLTEYYLPAKEKISILKTQLSDLQKEKENLLFSDMLSTDRRKDMQRENEKNISYLEFKINIIGNIDYWTEKY